MALTLLNTLKKEKEAFIPIKDNFVGMYSCGPTIYNRVHIGNWRAFVFTDLLRRFLEYKGFKVNHIMNITDVDDKTIKASQKSGQTLKELTEYYTAIFFQDRDSLNILPATKYTKATDYIKEMLEIIEGLIDKGFAYKAKDGSVYFDIRKYKDYGKLSNFKLSDLKENADNRLKKDEYEKENAEDFALWKNWTEEDGDVYWIPSKILDKDVIIEKGRPGWHIECSAMSTKNLGNTFDIHTGGVDLIFPHHENEIAQSKCSVGGEFAKYFVHNEHLLVNGQKMSKSLGNFYTLEDLVKMGIDPIAFRMWLYGSSYTTRVNFTEEAVKSNDIALNRLRDIILSLGKEIGKINEEYKNRFIEALDNNLESPKALSILWDLVKDNKIENKDKLATILDFDRVFGFGLDKIKEDNIPDEIIKIAEERKIVRDSKDWGKSDELRDKIKSLGYDIKDTDMGYKISKL
ncbi:MAG: cysteine--tRNA ligase [Candidatus Moranbacteria bacterium]|nr:cysteine--tRNA ligase [Candidatus Moranbacteria bacterium]